MERRAHRLQTATAIGQRPPAACAAIVRPEANEQTGTEVEQRFGMAREGRQRMEHELQPAPPAAAGACRIGGRGSPLVPPKPKLFFAAASMRISRASLAQ
jgi:hypothetical protein